MESIKIKFLEGVLNSKVTFSEIEQFKEDFELIEEFTYSSYLFDIKKIPKFGKKRTQIITFLEKYKELIQRFKDNDILYDMIGWDLRYHWDKVYKDLFLNMEKSNKENILLLFKTLKDNGFSEINFTKNDFTEIYYEKVRKKYNEEGYEIKFYSGDGKKEYLAQYYGDSFPIIFKDAKIMLVYCIGDWYYNKNKVILNSFDIDLNKLKFFKEQNEIISSIPFDEIKKTSNMCKHIRNIDKQLILLESNISQLEKLLEYEDLKEVYEKQLEELRKQYNFYEKLKNDTIESYLKLGYDKLLIDRSVEYLKNAEWLSSIDID